MKQEPLETTETKVVELIRNHIRKYGSSGMSYSLSGQHFTVKINNKYSMRVFLASLGRSVWIDVSLIRKHFYILQEYYNNFNFIVVDDELYNFTKNNRKMIIVCDNSKEKQEKEKAREKAEKQAKEDFGNVLKEINKN